MEQRTKGSFLYEKYIERFPNSTVARDQLMPDSGGHFSYNLYRGRYDEAWFRADGGNKLRMLYLGFIPTWQDRDLSPRSTSQRRFAEMVCSLIEYHERIGNINLDNIHKRE